MHFTVALGEDTSGVILSDNLIDFDELADLPDGDEEEEGEFDRGRKVTALERDQLLEVHKNLRGSHSVR